MYGTVHQSLLLDKSPAPEQYNKKHTHREDITTRHHQSHTTGSILRNHDQAMKIDCRVHTIQPHQNRSNGPTQMTNPEP